MWYVQCSVWTVSRAARVKLSRMKIWSRSGSNQSGQLLAWSAWWAGTPAACSLARVGHALPHLWGMHSLICGACTLSLWGMHSLICGACTPSFVGHTLPHLWGMHSLICVHTLSLRQPCPLSNSHVLPQGALFHSYNSACPCYNAVHVLQYNSWESLTQPCPAILLHPLPHLCTCTLTQAAMPFLKPPCTYCPVFTHTTVHAHATIVENHSHSRAHP